jgi:hypothetical protein
MSTTARTPSQWTFSDGQPTLEARELALGA